jgi:glyoxylase-like metal-dependent hydrolase (beta-lactamase superfamily II)
MDQKITRRGFFARAAAVGAVAITASGAGALGRPVAADEPAAGAMKGATAKAKSLLDTRPLHYPFRVGEFEAAVVSDGFLDIAPLAGGAISNATEEEVSPLLRAEFLPTSSARVALNTVVLRAGGKTILFDAGYGDEGGPGNGRQQLALAAVGVAPADIDIVVITHCHPDHLWGLVDGDGHAAYPRAEVVLHEAEFAFWDNYDNATQGTQRVFDGYRANLLPVRGRVRTLADGGEVVAGVNLVAAPGHTPGHSAFHLESNGERLLVTADTANHHVLFLARPDFNFGFDMDKEMAVATRRRVLGMAAADAIPILAYHFPFPGIGHVSAEGDGFRFHPRPWESAS